MEKVVTLKLSQLLNTYQTWTSKLSKTNLSYFAVLSDKGV